MPVTLLLVEGDLDAQLLAQMQLTGTTVEPVKAGKHAVLSRTRVERSKGNNGAYYLRDRDFDFEPSPEPDTPTVDRSDNGRILGWRWFKHAIESYMLEPAIVAAAFKMESAHYSRILEAAAAELQYYNAARWTIGLARGSMPRPHALMTGLGRDEFHTPELDQRERPQCQDWMLQRCSTHLEGVRGALDEASLRARYDAWCDQLQTEESTTPQGILLYYSGKDLMCHIAPHLPGTPTPGQLRTTLRDWIRAHPEETLAALPEWRLLVDLLHST